MAEQLQRERVTHKLRRQGGQLTSVRAASNQTWRWYSELTLETMYPRGPWPSQTPNKICTTGNGQILAGEQRVQQERQ